MSGRAPIDEPPGSADPVLRGGHATRLAETWDMS